VNGSGSQRHILGVSGISQARKAAELVEEIRAGYMRS